MNQPDTIAPPITRRFRILALVAGGVLWIGLVRQLGVEWSLNAQYSYGWGVPFLAAYLLFRRWEDAPNAIPDPGPPMLRLGVLLLLIGLLPTRLIQEANPDWRLVSWAYALMVCGVTLIVVHLTGGKPWLHHFLFPVLFILVAVPWPTPLEQWLIQGLMQFVAAVDVEILNWVGVPALQRGNLIELPSGLVGVSEACSGVRSFQSTVMAGLFLGEMYRLGVGRRLLLMTLGALFAFVLNVLRTLLLTLVNLKNGEAGLSNWHDPAGYIVLAISFAVLWMLALRMDRGSEAPQKKIAHAPLAVYPELHQLVIIAAIWIVSVEVGVEGWYRIHEVGAVRQKGWTVKLPSEAEGFRKSKIPEETRLLLRYNEGAGGIWRRQDGSDWVIYFFRWDPGRAAAQLARNHSPEACLPASGMRLLASEGTVLFEADGLVIPFRQYLFEYKNQPCYVFFAVWEDRIELRAGRKQIGADFSRESRLDAVLRGERHLGQRVLEIATIGPANRKEATRQVQAFLAKNLTASPN